MIKYKVQDEADDVSPTQENLLKMNLFEYFCFIWLHKSFSIDYI